MAPFTLGIIGFISDKYTCQIHSIGYPSSFIISLRTLTFAVEAKEDIGVMKKWDIGHGRRRKCAQKRDKKRCREEGMRHHHANISSDKPQV